MQKASPPASNPLLVLLDLINSPLLLFSDDGHVVFANQAAKQLDSRPALVLGSDPHVRELVKAIAQGKIVTHNELRVEALSDNGIAQLLCRCAPKPIAGLVAMAVSEWVIEDDNTQAGHPVAAQRLSLQEIMELIKGDLVPPIQQVLAQPGQVIFAQVNQLIHARGWQVKELDVERGRLDEVFRSLTRGEVA